MRKFFVTAFILSMLAIAGSGIYVYLEGGSREDWSERMAVWFDRHPGLTKLPPIAKRMSFLGACVVRPGEWSYYAGPERNPEPWVNSELPFSYYVSPRIGNQTEMGCADNRGNQWVMYARSQANDPVVLKINRSAKRPFKIDLEKGSVAFAGKVNLLFESAHYELSIRSEKAAQFRAFSDGAVLALIALHGEFSAKMIAKEKPELEGKANVLELSAREDGKILWEDGKTVTSATRLGIFPSGPLWKK